MRYLILLLVTFTALGLTGCGGDVAVKQDVAVHVPAGPAPITPTVPTVTPTVPDITPTEPTNPTTSNPPTNVATLTVLPPSGVTASSAVLRGSVQYTWMSTGTYGFQWGQDPGGNINWPSMTTVFLNGYRNGNVQAPLQEQLRPNTTYVYRMFLATGNAARETFASDVQRFTTLPAVQAVGAYEMAEGFVPSSLAPTTDILPTVYSIIVETQGYTNLGEDYVTLKGYVDVPNNLEIGAIVFFQISFDGESWNNWYPVAKTKTDGPFVATIGNLARGTKYFYRIGAGFSRENSVYGRKIPFATLASSSIRDEQLKTIVRLIGEVCGENGETEKGQAAQVEKMINVAGLHPKNAQAFCWQYVDVLVKGQMIVELSQSPEVDGAISEKLAGSIIEASDRVEALRSAVDKYFAKVYRVEFSHPYTTFEVVENGSVGSSLDMKMGAAMMVGAPVDRTPGVEVPNEMVVEILRGLIDGTNTLADRTRDVVYRNYNDIDVWTENFGTHLANKAFVAARFLNDFASSKGVSDLVGTSLRAELNGVRDNIKSLRTDFRSFQDRANKSSRESSRYNSVRMEKRYIDGEQPYDERG